MSNTDERFTYAIFKDEPRAAEAVRQLISAGFATERIGALTLDSAAVRERPLRHKTGVVPGVTIGALLGTVIGIVIFRSFDSLAVSGSISTLQAAITGAGAGALLGFVAGLGLWKDELDVPNDAFDRGAVLVGVTATQARTSRAVQALRLAGGDEPHVSDRTEAEARLRAMGHQVPH